MIKINSEDFLDAGFTMDEMLVTAEMLEKEGIDAIVQTWEEKNSVFLGAVENERTILGCILGFFILGKPLTFMSLFGVIALGGLDPPDALHAVDAGEALEFTFGDGDPAGELGFVLDDVHADHEVALAKVDALHAHGVAPHGSDVLDREANAHAMRGADENVLTGSDDARSEKGVALADRHADDAGLAMVFTDVRHFRH